MPCRLLVCSLVALVALAGCGSEKAESPAGVAAATTSLSSEGAAFCDAWNSAFATGDEPAMNKALEKAPPEIADDARTVREADASNSRSNEAEAASGRVLDWTELHCRRGKPGDSERRVAPSIDAEFPGLKFCMTLPFPEGVADERPSGMVLYGSSTSKDPYDGAMLGLLWNPSDGANHAGDGDSTPVTVRGRKGVAAPISVFQQTILPELGTVIAWTEGDTSFGLYGRRWSQGRADELVTIANRIEESDAGYRIPSSALPQGFGDVFSGDAGVTQIVLPIGSLYSLQYRGTSGTLSVAGLQMTEEEFEAFRFFTVSVDDRKVGERDALAGNAWTKDGPAVVTWREPDGLVVRIVGIGVPLLTAMQVANEARELSAEEWAAVVQAEDRCSRI